MRGFVLQDWITIQGDTAIHDVIQSPADWMNVEAYQDAILFLEVGLIVATGAIGFVLETAPSSDDALFKPVVASITMSASTTPSVTKVLAANASSTNPPLAKWLRFHVTSTSTTPWSVRFRASLGLNAAMGMQG
jgi:hypothetical protein